MASEPDPVLPPPVGSRDLFRAAAAGATRIAGGQWAFFLAVLTVVAWAVSGPYFGYSETWQLVINTGTTIVTFLMVFLIQNAQNRESKALHLKLDELILAAKRANNQLVNVESLTEDQLDRLTERYRQIGERYHREIEAEIESVGHEIEDHVEKVEDHVEEVEEQVEEVEERVKRVEHRVGAERP
jgi:low affinity Fe/Cu permease